MAGGPGWWLWQVAVPLLLQWHVCDSLLGECQGPKAWSAESALSEELQSWEPHTCSGTRQRNTAWHQAQKDGKVLRVRSAEEGSACSPVAQQCPEGARTQNSADS